MKLVTGLFCLAGLMVVAGMGMLKQETFGVGPAAVPAARNSSAEARVESVEDSMHEFMEYVFQPTYRRLSQQLKTAPTDNQGWKAIKSDSLILAESCNLLIGRQPEDDAQDWCRHAVSARSAGGELYRAAKTKDFAASGAAYRRMLEHCNACHRQFEDGKHILEQ